MEAISCVKAVLLAASQYNHHRSDDNLLYLHRQLDVLISITNKGSSLTFLHPKQLLSTEFIACLLEIMNDPQTKAALAHKTMTLLYNLASASFLREFLHSPFDVTAVLTGYMHVCLSQPIDENAVLCIKLLQKLTYKAETSAQQCYIEELVNFIIHQIVEVSENELTTWCLGLLANLCRNNAFVKSYIKNRENSKAIFKKLMSYLRHQSRKVEIFAISIICSICLEDEIGKRIFQQQNIYQVFQLLFSILQSGESGMTQQYAVDLFIDIVQFEKFQTSLVNYDHLFQSLQQILHLLTSADSNTSSMILELLVGFCQVKELRKVICRLLLEPLTHQDAKISVSQLASNRQNLSPLYAVIYWTTVPIECQENVPLVALSVLCLLFKTAFSERVGLEKLTICHDILLAVLHGIIVSSQPSDSILSGKHLQRKLKAAVLLRTLCNSDATCARLMSQFDVSTLQSIVEQQLATNTFGLNSNQSARHSAEDLYDTLEVGLDLMLTILDLMLVLCNKDLRYKQQLSQVLQDPRLIPLLAFSLTSASEERIHMALSLTFAAAAANPAVFNMTLLSENMSWLQKGGKSQSNVSVCPLAMPPSHRTNSSLSSTASPSSSTDNSRPSSVSSVLEASVQNLIDKMQKGLKVKDLRSSELIALYEHRLQSFQMKENHLQDLLEAKTATLLQSDRLLAQFRLRIAQYEAEGHKLRSLLQESEQNKEDLEEKLNGLTGKFELLHGEFERLGQENNRLETISEAHRQLTQDYAEQSQRLDSCQRTLKALRQEHDSLVEMDEMLKRHFETLRQQHDKASKHLLELEEEKNGLTIQLKDREVKVSDLSRFLQKTEENLKAKTSDYDELEVAIDKLRTELAKAEQARKELLHQVSSLEVVCRQREASIKEKDTLIEKHAQLTALIHSISGGKSAVAANQPQNF